MLQPWAHTQVVYYDLSKILKVCFHMVLSYARGSWRFKVASLVASSVAMAVRYGNVGGSFSGNEELVASLMAECDGKNEGKHIWVAKGVATLHGKNWAGNVVISFLWQKRCQNLMAVFWAEKIQTPYMTKEALSVHGTCWQKGWVWETFWRQMVWEVDGKSAGKILGNIN